MKHFGKKFWAFVMSAVMAVSAVSGPAALAAEDTSAEAQEAILQQFIEEMDLTREGDFEELLETEAVDSNEELEAIKAAYQALAEEADENEAADEADEMETLSADLSMEDFAALMGELQLDEPADGARRETDIEAFREAHLQALTEKLAEDAAVETAEADPEESLELEATNVAFTYLANVAKEGELDKDTGWYTCSYYEEWVDTVYYLFNVTYMPMPQDGSTPDIISLEMLTLDVETNLVAYISIDLRSDFRSPYTGWIMIGNNRGTIRVYPASYTTNTEYTASDFASYTGSYSVKDSMAALFSARSQIDLMTVHEELLAPEGYSIGDLKFTCLESATSAGSAVPGVTLSEEEVTIGKGKTVTLTATVLPANAEDKTVTWSSSDPSVATVSKGKVKGVAGGTCTITAACGGKSATCEVTVVEQIKGLKASATKISLAAGQDAELEITVKGSPSATYDLVASYDSEVMTVLKTDETTFLVTAGSRAVSGAELKITDNISRKTVKCKVSVGLPANLVTTKMKSTDVNLIIGKSATLKATASIAGSPVKPISTAINWSSSDESVAVVNSKGKVTTVGIGSCKIYAEAACGSDDCEPLEFEVLVVPALKTFTLYDEDGKKITKYTAEVGDDLDLNDFITEESAVWKVGEPVGDEVSYTYSIKAKAGIAELDEDSGIVTCLGKGKATVTVTLLCGSQKKAAKLSLTIV